METFYGNFKSWTARACFAAHQIAGRLGAPEALKRALRNGVQGIYVSREMHLHLRPGTWDAWTAHPGHERETHSWIARRFSGGAMVDVGAYCGSFSLRYVGLFERIYAFEASASNFSALTRNIALSEAGETVVATRAAVTPSAGSVRLYLDQPDTHSLIGSGPFEDVRSVSLDDSLLHPETIALLKIDVEGAELGVLKGARQLLSLGKVVVLAEANDEAHAQELRTLLSDSGYEQRLVLDGRNYVFSAA